METLLELPTQLQVISNQELKTELNIVSENTHCNAETKPNRYRGLKHFQKGVSGNPAGRPKAFGELRHGILEHFAKDPQKAIQRLYRERLDLYFAYAFGKPADRVELSGPDGGAIEVQSVDVTQIMVELAKRGVVVPQ